LVRKGHRGIDDADDADVDDDVRATGRRGCCSVKSAARRSRSSTTSSADGEPVDEAAVDSSMCAIRFLI
jgi:hypothetical protein